jgi:hypothetical protein
MISPISNSTAAIPATSSNSVDPTTKQDFDSLIKALQSNNLQGAKEAYTQLLKDNPTLAQNVQANPNSPLAQLGEALKSNDISQAQSIMQSIGKHHRHGQATISEGISATTGLPNGSIPGTVATTGVPNGSIPGTVATTGLTNGSIPGTVATTGLPSGSPSSALNSSLVGTTINTAA